MTDDCFSLPRRQQLRQVIRQRREACRDLPLALLRLEQLIRDVQRGQNRGLVRLDDRSLRQHLLQGLIHMGRDLARVFGRQIGAHRVLLPADHHLDRVLLRTHWAGLPAAPALVAPPAPTAPGALPAPPALAAPPLPPWRACSSRNVSRDSRSCTRTRAASTRCRSSLFSCSRSETRPLTSGSAFAPAPPPPLLELGLRLDGAGTPCGQLLRHVAEDGLEVVEHQRISPPSVVHQARPPGPSGRAPVGRLRRPRVACARDRERCSATPRCAAPPGSSPRRSPRSPRLPRPPHLLAPDTRRTPRAARAAHRPCAAARRPPPPPSRPPATATRGHAPPAAAPARRDTPPAAVGWWSATVPRSQTAARPRRARRPPGNRPTPRRPLPPAPPPIQPDRPLRVPRCP